MPETHRWLERRVISFAHQGGAWEHPSSTLFALEQARLAGATALEIDLHPTSDGHLVITHDPTVDRTTNGSGKISKMTLAEVQALDNAYWFIPGADVSPGHDSEEYPYRGRAPDDPMFRIPTLREVLERFPGVVLNLDIKESAPDVAPYEEALARLLFEFERHDDVIVASFIDPALDAFSAIAPDIPTSPGPIELADFWRAAHGSEALPTMRQVALQVPDRRGDLIVVDEPFVEAAHQAGMAVHVWTINDAPTMETLLDLGVEGIFTDVPTILAEILDDRDETWTEGLDDRLRTTDSA